MDEKKIKHLEFIQSNISRMNQCSFQMKGWMIAIVSALLALFASSINAETGEGTNTFLFVAIIPTIIFWSLDSYYFQQERKFRGIYNDLLDSKKEILEFSMPLNKYKGGQYNWFFVLWSKTEVLLYLPVIIGLFLAGFLI